MTYLKENKEYFPDFRMFDEIMKKLGNMFDSHEYWHHTHSNSDDDEMFEFKYKFKNFKTESWGIFCMGICVASGNVYNDFSYDECQDENYIKPIRENYDKILNEAITNTKQIFYNYKVLLMNIDENVVIE